jgi:hypothetical protein
MTDYEELQETVHTLDKRFSLRHFYYPSFEDTLWYVYYQNKRVCHISLIVNYIYMNDCIDGAKWSKTFVFRLGERSPVVARWVINQANECMRTLNVF